MSIFVKYAPYYDLFYLNRKPYERDCKMIYKWAERPDTLLDLCCGTANYWKYFPAREIMGIEKSKDMIKESKFDKNIIQGDVMEFNYNFMRKFECTTALFNAINYLPRHDWWKNLPLKSFGYFIFDIWNLDKIKKDGFKTTTLQIGDVHRMIEAVPNARNTKLVTMNITVKDGNKMIKESHPMYLYSHDDIKNFASDNGFEVDGIKETEVWHSWFKLRRR